MTRRVAASDAVRRHARLDYFPIPYSAFAIRLASPHPPDYRDALNAGNAASIPLQRTQHA
jgi:hypothetical protein